MELRAPVTFASFIEWETAQAERHELIDGIVYAMSGATKNHNRIVRNLANILSANMPGSCHVYAETVRLAPPDASSHYPDVLASCDSRDEADPYVVRFPAIIAEILSRSNRDDTLASKFRAYAEIPTLEHYLVIEQTTRAVIHYRFTPGDETRVTIVRHGSVDLGFEVLLDELYAGVPIQ